MTQPEQATEVVVLRMSPELLAQLANWSEPVRIRIRAERGKGYEMESWCVDLAAARREIQALDARGGGNRDHYIAADVRARAADIVRKLEAGA